eukprot:Pgem_evm1s1866
MSVNRKRVHKQKQCQYCELHFGVNNFKRHLESSSCQKIKHNIELEYQTKRLCVENNDVDQKITDLENQLKNSKNEVKLANDKVELANSKIKLANDKVNLAEKGAVINQKEMNTKLDETVAKYEEKLKLCKKKMEIESKELQKCQAELVKSNRKLTKMNKQFVNKEEQNEKLRSIIQKLKEKKSQDYTNIRFLTPEEYIRNCGEVVDINSISTDIAGSN